ncbi:DUF493 domain-containing protein [Fulvitalea axinellae]|uniref:DUF493 domain-containing protein n=1 Tax=Fulvitalea axinellae TaxID=1182444 RepID=A0AAU9CT69_9BACT|nr:DUF493 domain-containing protein [Fulvitalea axinellae]
MSTDHEEQIARFKEKLEAQHKFPGPYLFKFIVPSAKIAELKGKVLKGVSWIEKPSRNGRFVSLTAKVRVKSSDEVIQVYQKAKEVEGLMSL